MMSEKLAAYLLGIAIFFNSGSMLLIRCGGKNLDVSQGINHILTNGRLWIVGIALGWVAGMLFSLALTRLEVSWATAFYIPAAYCLVMIGSFVLLGESFTISKSVGIALTFAGLVFILRG